MKYKHKPTLIDAVEIKQDNVMDVLDFVGNSGTVTYTKDTKGNVMYTITQIDKVAINVSVGYYLIKNKDGISFNVMTSGEFEYNYEEA